MKTQLSHIILVIGILISESTLGQLYIGSGSSVQIEADATLGIIGDAENTGTYFNYGNISISGNWLNIGNYNTFGSFSTIGLDQQINHNTAFNSLIIDGGGNKNFISNITIANNLQLLNGYITHSTGTTIIMDETAISSEGSSLSYVNGTLFRSGTGDQYYPIGNNSGFFPAELHSIEGSSPIVGMSVPNNTTIFNENSNLITSIINTRYWQRTILSGTVDYSRISLAYNTSDNIYDSLFIDVVQSDSLDGIFESIGRDSLQTSMIPLNYASSSDTASKEYYSLASVLLFDFSVFYIPNAMSNNAPGLEDQTVKIYGDVFLPEGFSFTVSNNWGNIVFESHSLEQMLIEGWDGTNKRTGKKETTGQYNYILHAIKLDGKKYDKAGSIWIID